MPATLKAAREASMSKMIRLSSGVSVPYVEQGDANGIPVLLLHGFGGSWRSFAALLAYLSPSIHAFAFTQRGHGQARDGLPA